MSIDAGVSMQQFAGHTQFRRCVHLHLLPQGHLEELGGRPSGIGYWALASHLGDYKKTNSKSLALLQLQVFILLWSCWTSTFPCHLGLPSWSIGELQAIGTSSDDRIMVSNRTSAQSPLQTMPSLSKVEPSHWYFFKAPQ